jgi:hypothetical protein
MKITALARHVFTRFPLDVRYHVLEVAEQYATTGTHNAASDVVDMECIALALAALGIEE